MIRRVTSNLHQIGSGLMPGQAQDMARRVSSPDRDREIAQSWVEGEIRQQTRLRLSAKQPRFDVVDPRLSQGLAALSGQQLVSPHSRRRSPPLPVARRCQWRLLKATCRSSVWTARPALLPAVKDRSWRWARVHSGPSLMYTAGRWCWEAWWWPAASCALSAGT